MNDFIQSSYESTKHEGFFKKPLMIGCSGGGGHIAAIQGIQAYLETEFKSSVQFLNHEPVTFEKKSHSAARAQIEFGLKIMNAPILKKIIESALLLSPIPILPNLTSVQDEIARLSKNNTQKRKYVDMLLDVYPAGYESAAIWNVLQRDDKTEELKKLVSLQTISDQQNHTHVHDYYLKKLITAAKKGNPYTEVISTQAMSLPALCDAVKDYNHFIINHQIQAPSILIHQYMTDLPTKGAIHFFNPLSKLSTEQQKQMKLYGVGMTPKIVQEFFPSSPRFSSIIDIPPQKNPMVRQGFYDSSLDHSRSFEHNITLNLLGEHPIEIESNSKIASIMLGSQAGNDTFEYIEDLLKNKMDKVFVFGGKTNPILQSKINQLIDQHPEYQDKIIPLGNQGDKEIMPLMTRSNILVIRGGGLSVMEQLAMNHHSEQTVFIHHANSNSKNLTSGIPWEDCNVDNLIEKLTSIFVHCKKTCPARFERHLKEARLISAYKKYENKSDPDQIAYYISHLGHNNLKIAIELLDKSEKKSPPCFPSSLIQFLGNIEKKEIDTMESLKTKIQKILQELEKEVLKNWDNEIQLNPSLTLIEKNLSAILNHFEERPLTPCTKDFKKLLGDYLLVRSVLSSSENSQLKNYQKIELINDFCKKNHSSLSKDSRGLIQNIFEKIKSIIATYYSFFETLLNIHHQIFAEKKQTQIYSLSSKLDLPKNRKLDKNNS